VSILKTASVAPHSKKGGTLKAGRLIMGKEIKTPLT
jgi:hypothetical protein